MPCTLELKLFGPGKQVVLHIISLENVEELRQRLIKCLYSIKNKKQVEEEPDVKYVEILSHVIQQWRDLNSFMKRKKDRSWEIWNSNIWTVIEQKLSNNDYYREFKTYSISVNTRDIKNNAN